jgi:hypothetical protein
MRQSPTRLRSRESFFRNLMSPVNGFDSISPIAAKIRSRSGFEMRLRDFCAGPARATRHFLSSEFIECHVVTALDGGLTAANGTQLRRCRRFFWKIRQRKISLQSVYGNLNRLPLLAPRPSSNALTNRHRYFQYILLLLRHRFYSLTPRQGMSILTKYPITTRSPALFH